MLAPCKYCRDGRRATTHRLEKPRFHRHAWLLRNLGVCRNGASAHPVSIAQYAPFDQMSGSMGAVFGNAPIDSTVVAIQVMRIYFDAPCKYCRDGRRATTNVRPVDFIGRPMGDLNACTRHADQLIDRARARSLEVSIRDGRPAKPSA
jgi:hypothetical protein